MKQKIKYLVLLSLYCLGVFKLFRWVLKDKVTVLMLHGVMKADDSCTWVPLRNQTDPADLNQGIIYLKKYYNFISLSHAASILKGDAPPVRNAMVVTFDDGYRNNLDCALPVLKKHNIVPTLFVATGILDTKDMFWVDRLDYVIQQLPSPEYKAQFGGFEHVFITTDRESMRKSYRAFLDKCKYEIKDDLEMLVALDELATGMEEAAGVSLSTIKDDDPWAALADWREVLSEVEAGALEIGGHTVNHVRISRVGSQVAKDELAVSKDRIEQELNRQCESFCFPNGDHNQTAVDLVKETGYKYAVTTVPGYCSIGDDMYRLNRFAFPKMDRELAFLFELSGIRQFIRNIK